MRFFFRLSILGGLFLAPALAQASLTIVSSLDGQQATNVNYLDFNSLALRSGAGLVAGNTSDSFDRNGSTTVNLRADARVRRYVPNVAAAFGLSRDGFPALGAGNAPGRNSGITMDGRGRRRYIDIGSTSGSQAEFLFAEGQRYLGLLWGSVDVGNTLTFYFTDNTSQSISGSQINQQSTGNRGASGTFYVNFATNKTFDRVVASSVNSDFEFSNLAFSSRGILVPEASTMVVWSLLSVLAFGGTRLRWPNQT